MQNASSGRSAVPYPVANKNSFLVWQQKTQPNEQDFGLAKTVGWIQQGMAYRPQPDDQMFVLTMAAYNLRPLPAFG